MENETLTSLTSDIGSAYVGNNSVAINDMTALIQSVYHALMNVTEPSCVVEERREPAVSVRASVKPSVVTCMECGFRGKMLKRHLSTDHGLTPQEYRDRWNLSRDHPLVAPDYAATRAAIAKTLGLGRKSKR